MSLLRHPGFILVLVLLVVLLFGSKRLPDLARSVGQSLKILKKDVKDLRDDSGTPVPTPDVARPAPATPAAATDPTPPAQAQAPAATSGAADGAASGPGAQNLGEDRPPKA
ncbi:MAG: twin-arginine translocase TatA/TatE family subunit [Cellulomonadaceae bacterium]